MGTTVFFLIVIASLAGFFFNRQAARTKMVTGERFHSMAAFHGAYAICLSGLPALMLLILWSMFQGSVVEALVMGGIPSIHTDNLSSGELSLIRSEINSVANGTIFGEPKDYIIAAAERLKTLNFVGDLALLATVAVVLATGIFFAHKSVVAQFRARQRVETVLTVIMITCSTIAILTTFGIIVSLVFESARFFAKVPITDFLFGLNWEPQIPLRADQGAAEGAFGWLPVILGTIVIMVISLAVAVPIGLLSAIYLNEFASARVRNIAKPVLEVLAGVPTVVYGFFAILVVAPAIRGFGADLGIGISPNTALAAGSVMGIMLIPFISSFADDALTAVPRSLRDGSLALGATQGETVLKVLFPAAIPGIVGGILLAVSRAIGETMIVVMAAGLIATLTINPLDSVTTVTVQIVTLLIGDVEFDNPKTLSAFALGLMLFIVTLCLNIIALRVVRKYRELYD